MLEDIILAIACVALSFSIFGILAFFSRSDEENYITFMKSKSSIQKGDKTLWSAMIRELTEVTREKWFPEKVMGEERFEGKVVYVANPAWQPRPPMAYVRELAQDEYGKVFQVPEALKPQVEGPPHERRWWISSKVEVGGKAIVLLVCFVFDILVIGPLLTGTIPVSFAYSIVFVIAGVICTFFISVMTGVDVIDLLHGRLRKPKGEEKPEGMPKPIKGHLVRLAVMALFLVLTPGIAQIVRVSLGNPALGDMVGLIYGFCFLLYPLNLLIKRLRRMKHKPVEMKIEAEHGMVD